jgi:hypothetical protein
MQQWGFCINAYGKFSVSVPPPVTIIERGSFAFATYIGHNIFNYSYTNTVQM